MLTYYSKPLLIHQVMLNFSKSNHYQKIYIYFDAHKHKNLNSKEKYVMFV